MVKSLARVGGCLLGGVYLIDFFVFVGVELLEEGEGFIAEEVGGDLDAGLAEAFHVEVGDGEFVEAGVGGVGDIGAEEDFIDVGPVDGGEAHGAGFGGGVDGAALEVDEAELFAGEANGVDFSVGGDVGGVPDDVVSGDNEFIVFNDGGRRGFVLWRGRGGRFRWRAHPVGVGLGHGGSFVLQLGFVRMKLYGDALQYNR